MATTIDRAKSAFNKMFNIGNYRRFRLQSEEDGGSQMAVKMSNGNIDESETIEVTGQPEGSLPCSAVSAQPRRNLLCLAAVFLVMFISGAMIGYMCQPKPTQQPTNCTAAQPVVQKPEPVEDDSQPEAMDAPEPFLDWDDIVDLLRQKLTTQAFDDTLKSFDVRNLTAGGAGDLNLGNQIYDEFQKQQMNPWTDTHSVQLQRQNSEKPNRVQIGSDSPIVQKGYLAYSANGTVTGKVVYGNFGRREDLTVLQKEVDLKGCVMLLRAGKLSYAQQVANAAEFEASAVLIYPDPQQHNYRDNTDLYGHVHLGTGDPYSPGFPSLKGGRFSPTTSSGLPAILAQTINAQTAGAILKRMGGKEAGDSFKGDMSGVTYRLGGELNVTVEVNNVMVNTEIHNVFGTIDGFIDPDRYVVLGAQRDAMGNGYARATVGTTLLVELAKAVREMVKNDSFRPRRSLMFVSWSAGAYGSVGATEWLEGYMSTIDRKAFTYISLDGAVMGRESFIASASPMLYSILENTMKRVESPLGGKTLYNEMGGSSWMTNVLRPMEIEDPAYPFLAFAGIPSISFHFINRDVESYSYYGTFLDTTDHLDYQTNSRTSRMVVLAGQLAGQIALRLVHNHVLPLDVNGYTKTINTVSTKLYQRVVALTQSGQLKGVNPYWIAEARSNFVRVAGDITKAIGNMDVSNEEACRILNDRIMTIEHSFLSQYVTPTTSPFRHLFAGRGPHTMNAIYETTNMDQLHSQLALATCTLEGTVNAVAGKIRGIQGRM